MFKLQQDGVLWVLRLNDIKDIIRVWGGKNYLPNNFCAVPYDLKKTVGLIDRCLSQSRSEFQKSDIRLFTF